MSDSSPWSFSLTREDILARRVKRAEIMGEIETLQKQLAEEDRWLEAVKLIVPASLLAGIEEAIEGAQEGSERSSIWREAAIEALLSANRGMLPKELAQFIKEHGSNDAKDRIVRNPNGLYNALSRMVRDDQVIKLGDKFYLPGLYHALERSGELEDDADDRSMLGVGAFILSLFSESDRFLPRDIISKMREHEEYAERIEGNPQYGYSAIARLVRQRRLEKDGSHYLLPLKKNEPVDVSPSSGSDAELVNTVESLPGFLRGR